jgi:DNA-binding Lrp family transcriptional regulator
MSAHVRPPRPQREKMFGPGRSRPLDRNAKARIMVFARALSRRTQAGRAYGALSAKALAVLQALLWGFHNGQSGKCFPSYEKIAEAASCARSTVAEAIKALESAGILSWVHRLVRLRRSGSELDLFGRPVQAVRVHRTSNGYTFRDPQPGQSGPEASGKSSKSDFQTRTKDQDSNSSLSPHFCKANGLSEALERMKIARETWLRESKK